MSLTDKISAHVEATLPTLKLIRAENIDFEKAFVASSETLAWKIPNHIEVFFKLKNIDKNSKKILDKILVQYLRICLHKLKTT